MLNSPCHKVICMELHSLLFSEATWGKTERLKLSLASQSNSSNCLVLVLHRQQENYLLSTLISK